MEEYVNFKIIVLGPQAVGKTSLITRYINGAFVQSYNVTVGVEYSSKIVHIEEDSHVRLQIWDTAGQQLFKAVVRTFYKVYAINNLESFRELQNWVKQVRQHAHEEVVVFLLGSKSDLEHEREVMSEQAAQFMKKINAAFFLQVSSKTGDQIQALFNKASHILYKKYATNNSFRQLVRPSVASGVNPNQPLPQVLTRGKTKEKREKRHCCH